MLVQWLSIMLNWFIETKAILKITKKLDNLFIKNNVLYSIFIVNKLKKFPISQLFMIICRWKKLAPSYTGKLAAVFFVLYEDLRTARKLMLYNCKTFLYCLLLSNESSVTKTIINLFYIECISKITHLGKYTQKYYIVTHVWLCLCSLCKLTAEIKLYIKEWYTNKCKN